MIQNTTADVWPITTACYKGAMELHVYGLLLVEPMYYLYYGLLGQKVTTTQVHESSGT